MKNSELLFCEKDADQISVIPLFLGTVLHISHFFGHVFDPLLGPRTDIRVIVQRSADSCNRHPAGN